MITPQNALPYGWIGVIASFQFGIWYYLGIEGTTQAAEEVRSPARALPYGTMSGMITLLIAAALTWYVCASLLPWEYLGFTFFPLYDAARMTGSPTLEFLLFWGTVLSAVASAARVEVVAVAVADAANHVSAAAMSSVIIPDIVP